MAQGSKGSLVITGGHEDREGDKVVLQDVARRLKGGKVAVTTVASSEPDGLFEEYRKAFKALGVKGVIELPVEDREDANGADAVATLDGVTGVFFTGGDQLKITSQLGGTPAFRRIQEIFDAGGVIAGTSAGASAVSETMLVSGKAEESPKVGDLVKMAPGLGLLPGVIVDQHFAERGRMGRLLGAVAQNPKALGVGIDEDTACVVEGRTLSVLGAGGVYVIDGSGITSSLLDEADEDRSLSVHDVRLHVLSAGDRFDLRERRPSRGRKGAG